MRKFVVGVVVIGTLAFAGGAYAGGRWVITNINQIKPSVRHQLKGNQGPQGGTGAQGPQGPAGPAGGPGKEDTVISETLTLQPGQSSYDVDPNNFEANCPSGEYVIGTGFDGGIGQVDDVLSYTFFVGGFFYNDSSIAYQVHLQAICAPVSYGMTASIVRRTTSEATYQAELHSEQATVKR